ncbi:MAG: flagellar basal body-associated FliL family protein, partial [Oligoflexales bacterium]|nr:flagellar basal body-associated FliL family protein [Oligoflexales bacterium]
AGKEGEHGKKDEGKAGKDAKKEAPKDEKGDEAKIDFGETYPLKTFHLNLGNPLENRFVSIDISLEYIAGDSNQRKEIERRDPQIRDAVVSIVSRKTMEFLLAPDGKTQLRKEIKTRINSFMSKPITQVFITDILIE